MEELIQKARKGDTDAYTELILSIKQDLYKIAKSRINNEYDIDDAIQETMIEVYKSIKKLKDIDKFKKWTIKILINKCNRIYRRKYKEDIELNDTINNYASVNKDLNSNLNFYSMLNNLNYDEKIVVILFYMEDYTIKEISKILRIKESTIKTRLHRAKGKIKDKLGGEYNG